jgi:anaerobic selenocysteine-containing dehydrogenase
VVGACSLDCPDGCSWLVSVDDEGVPIKVRGNPDHPFTAGGLCTTTLARTGEPPVVVSSANATRDGVISGQRVVIANARGSFSARLITDDRVARRGVASISKGWGGVNRTVREEDSDMGAVFHDNAVRITPWAAAT